MLDHVNRGYERGRFVLGWHNLNVYAVPKVERSNL